MLANGTRWSTPSPCCSPASTSSGSSGATARSTTRSSAVTPGCCAPISSTPRPASCTLSSATDYASTNWRSPATNIAGGLLDLQASGRLAEDIDPAEVADELVDRYRSLWAELTATEVIPSGELWRMQERMRRLNDLGFDADEYELVTLGGPPSGAVPALRRRGGPPQAGVAPAHRHRGPREPGSAGCWAPSAATARGLPNRAGTRSPKQSWRIAFSPSVTSPPSTPSRRNCGGAWKTPRSSIKFSNTPGTSPRTPATTSVWSWPRRAMPTRCWRSYPTRATS